MTLSVQSDDLELFYINWASTPSLPMSRQRARQINTYTYSSSTATTASGNLVMASSWEMMRKTSKLRMPICDKIRRKRQTSVEGGAGNMLREGSGLRQLVGEMMELTDSLPPDYNTDVLDLPRIFQAKWNMGGLNPSYFS